MPRKISREEAPNFVGEMIGTQFSETIRKRCYIPKDCDKPLLVMEFEDMTLDQDNRVISYAGFLCLGESNREYFIELRDARTLD